ncbi:MAG: 3-oxoacyl-[Bacteroidales bacterium]|nr:3-oxoacyl-[acyl-carrier-protein] reductase [Bacteroidales bacterium]MBR4176968.1 3-oxoacyl-[acyl-carrier-protein] reductase [Bacteroidales bacterium]MBR4714896.1 3-oxoacyl-[acyl-carrier-protein] reductase [Bacteroidales bacterium]MCR4931612.1 3-oxoacyl-[acyl-carrier-protein] reductase [Bacteroidales bacterium]
MKLLENKTALITGASRGIGRSHALLFAEEGANIIFTDLKANENSDSLLAELRAKGVRADFLASNAADNEQANDVAKWVADNYGRLDILVNNAGITKDQLILRMSVEDWNLVMDVNLRSVFNYTKAFAPMMMKQRAGSIINISSIVGLNGNAGQCNYSASKAGIIGFTRSIAKELGSRNIRCNAVAPGFIETPMTQQLPEDVRKDWMTKIPLRRGGLDTDVAHVSLFLASDLASYVTGQVISCDGGLAIN